MPKHDSTPIDTWRASCLASIKLAHRLENEANNNGEEISLQVEKSYLVVPMGPIKTPRKSTQCTSQDHTR